MKKRTNKGMALASTVIMMTIVMMMSALMMTLSLYCSQVTSLNAQKVEDRKVLEEIGNRFLKNKDNSADFLSYYVANSDMEYYDTLGNPTNDPQNVIKGTCNGIKMAFHVSDTASKCSLTVSNLKGKQLMKIECVKTTDARTGEVSTELKSWAYAG